MEVMKTTFKFILVTSLLEGANFFNPNKLIVIREAKIKYMLGLGLIFGFGFRSFNELLGNL